MRWLVLLALASCTKPRWGDKVATELHIAGQTLAIPAGWRSLAELEHGFPGENKPGPDTVAMMPEVNREGVITATIIVSETKPDQPWSSCADAVAHARAGVSPPISDVHDGGEACTWHVDMKRVVGTVGLRKMGEKELSLECLRDAAGDPEADRVCDQVIATLHMR